MRNNLFLGVAMVALVAPMSAIAQETTSSIRGSVTSGGAPVAGATIVATNVPSGTRSEATTDASGSFNLNGLRAGGPYTVEVTATEGTTSVTDVFTIVGQPYELPIDLAETGGSDIVVTASSIARAGSVSDGPQTTLTKADIEKVASVNRDIRDLARRSPFARIEDTAGGGRSVSFAGINPRFNRFSIDGVIVSDNFGLNPDANPTRRGPVPFDAISQFSVSVAPFDIRQGNFVGGAIDATLLSGTNEFHGTGFYSQNTDGLSGEKLGDSIDTNLDYKAETYGATISGPIIPDKLFFMVSAERSRQASPFSNGILSEGFGNQIPGLTRGQITTVQQIAQATYSYDAGDLLSSTQLPDEKIAGKIDWNITDDQRLSISYLNAYDNQNFVGNASTNASSPSIGLASNGYGGGELLRAGIAQLNSKWTDSFSTEARFLYKSYERTRPPLGEGGFAQMRVCSDTVGTVDSATSDTLTNCGNSNPNIVFGVENSTQANTFYTDTYGGSLLARLNLGSHNLRLLTEYNQVRIQNLFFQNTFGNYYFDSTADLQNRQANELIYANALSGNQADTGADFRYEQWTFGIQDSWQITDRLNVDAGVRYDLYGMRDRPAGNNSFAQRYGFYNNATLKGRSVFQPRIGFDWEPIDDVTLRGGFGVFAGGTPDVYLANSFQNSGVGTNSILIRRTGANTYTINGAPLDPALGAAALNDVTGRVPASLQALLVSNANAATGANLAPTNALDPDFDIPSVRKATASIDWSPRDLLGGGWTFGADYYYSDTQDQVFFTDLRSIPIGTLPDGRVRYGPLVGTNTNTDILLTNTDRGRSHIGVVRIDKKFDFGLTAGIAYALQDVKDATPATSSTAGSNYGNGAFFDGRGAAYGAANDQVAWSFKYSLGFDKALFGDARTRLQLFGETQAGRPYSFTMDDVGTAPRSPVFGVTGRDDRFLLYVPSSGTDAIVSYDNATTQQSLETLINNTKLKDYRGKVAARNIARSSAYTRIDLHVEQEIPTFIGKSRISIFADVENLPNLLNKDWGGFRQAVFPYVEDAVRVQCLNTAVATGTTPTAGQINTASNQPCVQYRYSNYIEPNEKNVETRPSLYLIRLGARFSF